MIDWVLVKKAVFDWSLLPFPQLSREACQWRDQKLPRPEYPYLMLKVDSVVSPGGQDEERWETDLEQPLGKEISIITTGPREFTLNVRAYVDEANGANDPSRNAMAMLTRLRGTLRKLVTQELFCPAGLAVVEEMPVLDISEERNGQIVSIASMDIRMRVTSESTERTGYIDSAEIASNGDCSDQAITVPTFTT